MKVKQLSFEEWTCITKKKFLCRKVPDGYVSLLAIEEVTEPQIWDFRGDRIPVCDRGMTWISHLVPEEHYCLTAMLDAAGEAVLWYADMIAEAGVRGRRAVLFGSLSGSGAVSGRNPRRRRSG